MTGQGSAGRSLDPPLHPCRGWRVGGIPAAGCGAADAAGRARLAEIRGIVPLRPFPGDAVPLPSAAPGSGSRFEDRARTDGGTDRVVLGGIGVRMA
ncbi:MAG: hypothetical protein ACXIUV_04685 [Alkalilacustris sp.]